MSDSVTDFMLHIRYIRQPIPCAREAAAFGIDHEFAIRHSPSVIDLTRHSSTIAA